MGKPVVTGELEGHSVFLNAYANPGEWARSNPKSIQRSGLPGTTQGRSTLIIVHVGAKMSLIRYPADQEDRYRLLVENITDYAIYLLEPTGTIASWNAGAARFKGYSAEEILGQHFSRFYTEDDRTAGLPAKALEIAEQEGRFEGEGWRVRKDGSRFWTSVVIDAIRCPDGKLIGFAKITRDLTERRRAEEILRQSEEQFRILVQSVTDYAIFMIDPHGNVSTWNTGAERIKGYAAEEIIGKNFSLFYSSEDQDKGMPALALKVAAEQGRFEREGWRIRKDGSRFMAHVIIDAVQNRFGELIGFAKITRDITERLQHEREMEQAREALFQAQKMEAIGRLSGGVAHDYNNLLAAIIGGLTLLRKQVQDAKAHSLIDNIFLAVERGVSLTKRLLSFARRQELKREMVEVGKLIANTQELLSTILGPSTTISGLTFGSDLYVETDAHHLETALVNLIINARDAMPDGGRIEVSALHEELSHTNKLGLRAGTYVQIRVRDTGHGMDPDTLARAREPFFTTKGIGKGTGLGLSMVHGFVEQSHGHLEIESQPGVGTTVRIRLPAPQRIAFETEEVSSAKEEAAAVTQPLRILVVDDDELVLSSTAALLEDLGHKVDLAGSGQQAMQILGRSGDTVDLVLTDQAMPQMTGFDLATQIRQLRPLIPIILATGFAEFPGGLPADIIRLPKPFMQAEVASALIQAFEAIGQPAPSTRLSKKMLSL